MPAFNMKPVHALVRRSDDATKIFRDGFAPYGDRPAQCLWNEAEEKICSYWLLLRPFNTSPLNLTVL
jgi:hypothetical protein